MLRKILAISLMSVTSIAAADTLDIGLSNKTAQFKYGVPSTLAGKSEMYAELMYNNDHSVIGGVGLLLANDEIKGPGLTIGLGAKAVAATIKSTPSRKSASAVALGAQVRYELPAERRVAFAGEFYYAPTDHYLCRCRQLSAIWCACRVLGLATDASLCRLPQDLVLSE